MSKQCDIYGPTRACNVNFTSSWLSSCERLKITVAICKIAHYECTNCF